MVLVRLRRIVQNKSIIRGKCTEKQFCYTHFQSSLCRRALARKDPILYNSEKKAKSVGSVGSSVRLKTCVVDCVFISGHSGMLVNARGNIDRF